jgi:hypothetical protein
LWPDWRDSAFLTNRTDALELVEAEHRQHAVVELAIRDLKDQALVHFPSGKFLANAAWTVIAALAHNLLRWTTDRAARHTRSDCPHATSTVADRSRPDHPHRPNITLRLPSRWPWETQFLTVLQRLRAVPALS